MAVLCSLLLGSCTSTNDPNLDFSAPGFNAPSTAAAHQATEAGVATPATAETLQTADAAGTAPATVMDDSDQALPVAVAYLPTARPALSGTGTISLQQAVEAEAAAARMAAAAQQAAEQPATLAQAPMPATKPETQAVDAQPAAQPVQVAATAEMNNPVYVTAGEPQKSEPEAPKKKGFLASLFGASSASPSAASGRGAPTTAIAKPLVASAAPSQPAAKPLIETTAAPTPLESEAPAKPLIQLASAESPAKPASLASTGSDIGLPGVRQTALFEIRRKSGIDDDSDVDLHEEEDGGPVQVASAAGMARLAPNGLLRQTENVDVACLKPSLVRMLKSIEQHYGGKIVVTSGYRSPTHNRRARGAKNSLHMYCAAADIQIEGVGKWELANYVRTMPGRGGVGTYCHTDSVHVDVGPERDWNWRCRRRK
ncbi:uncharacterized protein YcbK (DUF882 family) [Mesorhizobium soli]|uniref:D-Ala-D-Ala carboxypeptidase family metallohydrolase n=1 Tax=Pseudaminobacter soli (ex Li et al. 2025) TaxID=1295366 RepID=UPI002473B5FF|nr:D-Ala-D-Ala carboxypeptidase family metallohydrolase [Mesorhizobium soli]MDH6229533.1 uncharacterized protein YcbK (DUF882 family) [Mesorhizobium soli]